MSYQDYDNDSYTIFNMEKGNVMNKVLIVSFLILSSTCALHTMNTLPTDDDSSTRMPFTLAISEETYRIRAQDFIEQATAQSSLDEVKKYITDVPVNEQSPIHKIFKAMVSEHVSIHACTYLQCYSPHSQLVATTNFVTKFLRQLETVHPVEPAHFRMRYQKISVAILSAIHTGDETLFRDAIIAVLEERSQPQYGLHVPGISAQLSFPVTHHQ